jgi:hypothetical protein
MKRVLLAVVLGVALIAPFAPAHAAGQFCVAVPKLGVDPSQSWVSSCSIPSASGIYGYLAVAYNDWEICIDGCPNYATNTLGKPTWQSQARARLSPAALPNEAGRETGTFTVPAGSHTITARLNGGCGPIPPVGSPPLPVLTNACGAFAFIAVWEVT